MYRSIPSSFVNALHFLNKLTTVKATMTESTVNGVAETSRLRLTGRAFYESIGSPNMIVAPMVDRSEFVCSPIIPARRNKVC